MNWIQFAMAQPEPGGASPWSMLFPLVLMIGIFYFLLIRPQQKRQKDLAKMVNALKKGDRVVTSSGIYGTVSATKDDVIVVKIAENVKVEMMKSAISGVVNKGEGQQS